MLTHTHVMKALDPTTCVPLCPSDPPTSQCPWRLLGSNAPSRQGRRQKRPGAGKAPNCPNWPVWRSQGIALFSTLWIRMWCYQEGLLLLFTHSLWWQTAFDGSLWNNYSLVIPDTHHRCTHLIKPKSTPLPSALSPESLPSLPIFGPPFWSISIAAEITCPTEMAVSFSAAPCHGLYAGRGF